MGWEAGKRCFAFSVFRKGGRAGRGQGTGDRRLARWNMLCIPQAEGRGTGETAGNSVFRKGGVSVGQETGDRG